MDGKIRVGISTCLLGENVRYDGGHKLDRFLRDTLGQYVEWVPVCPEVECGLPIPREAMHLEGDPDNPRLVTLRTKVDHTGRMKEWAAKRLKGLAGEGLVGFVFKSDSPSSGWKAVKVYNENGLNPRKAGVGIFAREFTRAFPLLPVEEEGRLHDPGLRENFIERLFVFKRWQDLMKKPTRGGLVDFHTDHKLLLMAHGPKLLTELGRIVAAAKGTPPGTLYEAYLARLMSGLEQLATVKKNTNALEHIAGYFKKTLSADERAEIKEVIGEYHRGYVPLVVPVTLLKHYVRKYDEPYLRRQYYLNPHPAELMLRNHV
ncbi:MAG TPA: DUF523 and DUF1722 domain-containing protein [bacterium]|nr:DUF523 and DUF1722 domain-containing protein [bacterium]